MKMRSKKSYVNLDEYDTRSTIYSEDEFRNGITFNSKFIGACEVPRPTSRVEIVAAMRRIRYDFKCKAVKKRKIILTVSTEGVRVALREKGKTPSTLTLMQYPICRIFYVSHDSLDMNIFSFISRDGQVFKCCVFKTAKKAQATRIVRAIGQAFEVCHKLSSATCNKNTSKDQNQTAPDIQSGDVTPPPPSTPDTPLSHSVTTSTKDTGGQNLIQVGHKTPSIGSHPPSTQGTIIADDQRSVTLDQRSVILDHTESHSNSNFSHALKVIEDKLELLTTRIVKMEENQDKLISILMTEKSGHFSPGLLTGSAAISPVQLASLYGSKIPPSWTFPSNLSNNVHPFTSQNLAGQQLSGHSYSVQQMNGQQVTSQQQRPPSRTDTSSYLSLCLSDSPNSQQLQHLHQLFLQSQTGTPAENSQATPGIPKNETGGNAALLQQLFNYVPNSGVIKPPESLPMMSPGKDSLFSSGISSQTSSPPSLTSGMSPNTSPHVLKQAEATVHSSSTPSPGHVLGHPPSVSSLRRTARTMDSEDKTGSLRSIRSASSHRERPTERPNTVRVRGYSPLSKVADVKRERPPSAAFISDLLNS